MKVVTVMIMSMSASSHLKKLMCSVQVDFFLETSGKSNPFVLVLQFLQTMSAVSVLFILTQVLLLHLKQMEVSSPGKATPHKGLPQSSLVLNSRKLGDLYQRWQG